MYARTLEAQTVTRSIDDAQTSNGAPIIMQANSNASVARQQTETVEIDEQLLSFGVSGKLVMNVLVMFDNETDTYWSQLIGEAIEGPLMGAKLTPLAAAQTTWGEWKKIHPDTKALVTNGAGRYDSYSSYYAGGQAGVIGEARSDDRLPTKELIAGVVIDDTPVAYPHSKLAQEIVVNDTINDIPIAVVFDPATATSQIFERTVDGRVLTFAPGADPIEFTDEETGSTWLLLTGMATDGELAGQSLTKIPATASFWFGWKDFYPETLIYGE